MIAVTLRSSESPSVLWSLVQLTILTLMLGLDKVALDMDAWRDGGVQWGVIGGYCLAALSHVTASSSARCELCTHWQWLVLRT